MVGLAVASYAAYMVEALRTRVVEAVLAYAEQLSTATVARQVADALVDLAADIAPTATLRIEFTAEDATYSSNAELPDGPPARSHEFEHGRIDVWDEADASINEALISRVLRLASAALERLHSAADERRAAQTALALRYITEGVIVVDARSVITVWTSSTAKLLGVPSERAIGRLLSEVIDEWPRMQRYVPVLPHDMTGEVGRADPVPISVERDERWVVMRGVEAPDGSVVFTLRDASRERLRDQRLLDYVATASHQLRTPVAAIHGAAITLQRDDIELAPEHSDQFLDMIVNGAERLVRTVDSILDIGRLQGEPNVRTTDILDVAQLVGGIVDAQRTEALPVTLLVDVPKGLRVTVEQRAFEVALTNLVENAIKYSPEGGDVQINVGLHKGVLRTTVADHGIGISQDDMPHVFDKFYRADPHMRRGIAGTGLGLFITAEMVERAGGRISVHSTAGSGTTFTVDLPTTNLSTPRAAVKALQTQQRRGAKQLRTDASLRRLIAAVRLFDARAVHEELSHLFATYGRSLVLKEVIAALLVTVGGNENPTAEDIAAEHFLSNIIRGRLWTMTRDWQIPGAPVAVLACAPHEQHDLGLVMFGISLNELGWSISWLGMRTPISSIHAVADAMHASAVVVAAVRPTAVHADDVDALETLAAAYPTFVGGTAAEHVQGLAPHTRLLGGSPTDGAMDRWFIKSLLEERSHSEH